MEYERHYVWTIPLRIFHWVFALSFAGLVVTGLYIHWPWTNTMLEGTNRFPMATMRDIHFQLGYYFIASTLLRYYLLFFGNKQERFTDFFPISLRNIKSIPKTIVHYLYLSDEHDHLRTLPTLSGITSLAKNWRSTLLHPAVRTLGPLFFHLPFSDVHHCPYLYGYLE